MREAKELDSISTDCKGWLCLPIIRVGCACQLFFGTLHKFRTYMSKVPFEHSSICFMFPGMDTSRSIREIGKN